MINMTPKRLRALRLIEQRPGMYVSGLIEVCDRRELSWGADKTWIGFDKAANGNQAATRWGAAYAKPLIAAGLVRMDRCFPGCGRLYLTDAGRRAAIEGK